MRKTNTKPNMLRATAIALCLLCLFQACPAYATPASVKATPTGTVENSRVYLNGEMIVCSAYNIGGANYFKLRDIMQELNVYVSYTEVTKTINIYSNWPYIPDGAETSALIESNNAKGITTEFLPTTAVPTTAEVLFDGRKVDWEAYNIGGSNHFKLRDICYALNISVEWDENAKTVWIDTSMSYGDVNAKLPPTNEEIEAMKLEVVRLTNIERQKEGLPELQMLPELMDCAQLKADDMKINNYVSHDSPIYGSFMDLYRSQVSTGFPCQENLTLATTPQSAVNNWMRSPGHREGILNKQAKYIGIGIHFRENYYGFMFVQQFAK